MNLYNGLLAAMVVYLPYAQHYKLAFDLKGLNTVNLLFLVALVGLVVRKAPSAPAPTPLKGRFLLVFALFSFATLVGAMYDASAWVDDVTALKNALFPMLLFFLYYHAPRDEDSIRVVVGAIVFVTFLVSLQCVRQGLDYGLGVFNPSHRVAGPFAADYWGANLAAAFLVIFLPFCFAVVLNSAARARLRLLALATLVLGVPGLFFTYSRQGYLILAVLLLLVAMRRSVVVAVAIAIAVASYQSWVPESVVQRIEMTEKTDQASGEKKLDESTESRFIIWTGAASLIADRPWGVGLNHFKREIPKAVPPSLGIPKDAHNGFVLVATETGVAGVLAFTWLLAGMFFLARRIGRLEGDDAHLLGGGLAIATLGVVGGNLFGSRFFEDEIMGNYWVLCGLAARYWAMKQPVAKAA